MKTLLSFLLIFAFLMASCSKSNNTLTSEDLSINIYPQTWKLVKMTGSLEGSESAGDDMDWQENYVFKSDGSFLKTRITEEEIESASGNYSFDESTQNFILNYEQASVIIGNCGSNTEESLYFNKESKILQSNWWACDGPGLFYEREK